MGLVREAGERALASAVEGRILSRLDDEVPTEEVEVDSERIATAVRVCCAFHAIVMQMTSTLTR